MESKGCGLTVVHGLDLVAVFLFRQVGCLRSCAKVAARHFIKPVYLLSNLPRDKIVTKVYLYKYSNFHLYPLTVKSDLCNSQ